MTPAEEKLTSLAPSNYFTVGLNNALNESEGRRNVLLEKLKEAQDTLRVTSPCHVTLNQRVITHQCSLPDEMFCMTVR